MPNYAFECKKCGERFDTTESIPEHNRHREKCPKCGSKDLMQRISTFYAKTSKKS